MSAYEVFEAPGGGRILAWVRGVPVEPEAIEQLRRTASLPFVRPHVAAMPDVHVGIGSTVGSVVPTRGALIPAAVGVDIGCGMTAARTSLTADRLPDDLRGLRDRVERAVPVGFGKGGDWTGRPVPASVATAWRGSGLAVRLARILARQRRLAGADKGMVQLGTLGSGNHFIELCLDESERVWVLLHSGSRGTGNRIGVHFISEARSALARRAPGFRVADRELGFFLEGETLFDEYVEAVGWAQDYARVNRRVMLERVLEAMRGALPSFELAAPTIDCHHNYAAREEHFDERLWITRKGAVRANRGELGIVPGSMGARSFIVRGKGAAESFRSCSHGAGRRMSRKEARRRFSVEEHRAAVAGVECRTDAGVLDETPMAYKDIDAVIAAQADLLEVLHSLRAVLCVKG